ncbi:MAG: helix-turn-helix domain-containing protein [Defluviitaleaceae bacterium]|nr:helix-turn-helix domain-containing protein [Defluviitaleaceae bacterium]
MTDLKSTGGKHLTLDERQEIMECLDKGFSNSPVFDLLCSLFRIITKN